MGAFEKGVATVLPKIEAIVGTLKLHTSACKQLMASFGTISMPACKV